MPRDPGYPSNTFLTGVLNALYGGGTAREWGGEAWDFLQGLVRDHGKWLLTWKRKPYDTNTGVTQASVVAGDILCIDLSQSTTITVDVVTEDYPYIAKFTGAANQIVIGIALESAGAVAEVHFANGGLLPAKYFGLAGSAAGTAVSANTTTSRLKVWVAGDEILGFLDAKGNVLFLSAARAASL